MAAPAEFPYIDMLLQALREGRPELTETFGRHMHWGYWGPRDRPDGSAADFAAAAERLSRRLIDASGARDSDRILDAGCGLGGTLAALDERLSNVELVGLNIDPRQLDRARGHLEAGPGNRIDLVEGDACKMPFADGAFDVVLAVECVFHFPSRARFLREARRVLRPGGCLALCDFVPIGAMLPGLLTIDLLFRRLVERTLGPVDIRTTLPAYLDLARDAGLRPTHEEDITASTVPTYAALRRLIPETGVPSLPALAGITALESVARLSALRYMILVFSA